jgi:cytochrome b subunit of formate dehydrogenase
MSTVSRLTFFFRGKIQILFCWAATSVMEGDDSRWMKGVDDVLSLKNDCPGVINAAPDKGLLSWMTRFSSLFALLLLFLFFCMWLRGRKKTFNADTGL